jgi:hypothetical protein
MMMLKERFSIVKIHIALEIMKIEIEGEGYWVPIHISSLGIYPPMYDWELPGSRCNDVENYFIEAKNSPYKGAVNGKTVYEWHGVDEMVINIPPGFMLTGEYEISIISKKTILSPPAQKFTKRTSLRTQKDRIDNAHIYLNQEFDGSVISLNYIAKLNEELIILEDPVTFVIFVLPASLFKTI